MLRKLFAIVVAVTAAVLGVMAGRAVTQMREQTAAGAPLQPQVSRAGVHGRDVMPGLVAALRVRDRPWSYLHIPSWLAAFAVNFAFVALRSELRPWLRTLGFSIDQDEDEDRSAQPARGEVWTAETPPAYTPPPQPAPAAEGFRPFA